MAKYVEATRAEVSLAQVDGHLRFAVVDDGAGFDAGETSYGTGVQGMADRLDAIGGALQVVSRKGGGTPRRPDPDTHELRRLTDPAASQGGARPRLGITATVCRLFCNPV